METLTVELGREVVALPLASVEEVVRMPKLGPLPDAGAGVLGCLDLRGDHLLVVDLFGRLGLGSEPVRASQVLVVVRLERLRVALRASRVEGVVSLEVGPLPPGSAKVPCVTGLLEGRAAPVPLLDLGQILAPERARAAAPGGSPS